MFEQIISIIAPHHCLGCSVEGTLWCLSCQDNKPSVEYRCITCATVNTSSLLCKTCTQTAPFRSLRATTAYKDVPKELVHLLKFERAMAAAVPIASLMSERLSLGPGTIVTHIPTATSRIRERGYDQAAVIAKHIAGNLSLPFVPLLSRLGQQRQLGAGRATRHEQLQGSFRVTYPYLCRNRDILLIDDVVTTGSTLTVASKTLQNIGARNIDVRVFASA